MKTNRLSGLALIALLTVGCGNEPAAPILEARGPQNPEFDTDVALQIIGAAPDFGAVGSRITVIERNMLAGEEEGLWSFRRWRSDDGYRRVKVELSPEAQGWFDSAEYNVGGVVRLWLSDPLTRRIVKVDQVTDTEWPQMKEVQFQWEYGPVPESVARIKPELVGGPYRGVARLQYQIDSWKIVGAVRDFQIPL